MHSGSEDSANEAELPPPVAIDPTNPIAAKITSPFAMSYTPFGPVLQFLVPRPSRIQASTQTEFGDKKPLKGLKKFLLESRFADFIVNVKGKEFRVHKIILAAQSPVFEAMMKHDTQEKATGTVKIDDFEPDTFANFLNFLYTDRVENFNLDTVLDLFGLADKYQVNELCSLCYKYLMNNISIENFCDILTLSLRYQVRKLTEKAEQFFLENSKEIILTTNWGTFLAQNPVAGKELLNVLNLNKQSR